LLPIIHFLKLNHQTKLVKSMLKILEIPTRSRIEFINVDRQIEAVVAESGVAEGLCVLWVPHTTAAVTINENADPDVVRDILMHTNGMIPCRPEFRHSEGNSDAHIKSSLFGPSLTLIVTEGRLLLGTWQSVYFCEFDGPRRRRLVVKVVEG
jgi:secondary thiamine-phosphate synthase enzyme